jgi:hypothetical protein
LEAPGVLEFVSLRECLAQRKCRRIAANASAGAQPKQLRRDVRLAAGQQKKGGAGGNRPARRSNTNYDDKDYNNARTKR